MCWCRPEVKTPFCQNCAPALAKRNSMLEGHRARWRRIAFQYRDALEAIEGGHVCDEGHREEARKALLAIEASWPSDESGQSERPAPEPK